LRKTYVLTLEGKNRDRLLEASKHDIRKYVKRERSRVLPPGVDYWDFDCRFGASEAAATAVHFATLMGLIDALAKEGGAQFYVEIVAKHGLRTPRPRDAGADSAANSG
jgi:hypothetical protein